MRHDRLQYDVAGEDSKKISSHIYHTYRDIVYGTFKDGFLGFVMKLKFHDSHMSSSLKMLGGH